MNNSSKQELSALWQARPQSLWLKIIFSGLGILLLWVLVDLLIDLSGLFTAQRAVNLKRFVGELVPYPLRSSQAAFTERVVTLLSWTSKLLREGGLLAMMQTFLIAVAAICLAGLAALLTAPWASRTLTAYSPYAFLQKAEMRSAGKWQRLTWTALRITMAAFFALIRALPEVLLAFLLVSILGLGPWAAVLALFLHNWGILGRLSAEGIDHAGIHLAQASRAIGHNRSQSYFATLLPRFWGRFFVYFFYRWETCIREATVMGFVGIASLGFLIRESRARDHYDEMVFYVFCGAVLVLLGDWISNRVRAYLLSH